MAAFAGGEKWSTGADIKQTSLPEKTEQLLKEQVDKELAASRVYFAASIYFDDLGFGGIASYLKKEADGEQTHAGGFSDYLIKRGSHANLGALNAVAADWDSPVHCFEALLEAEVANTASINAIAEQALQDKDHMTYSFLKEYLDEQVNAEDEWTTNVQKIRSYAKLPGLLWHLDKEFS
mmetsp:Transcript_7506/g.21355  ORF Transcript_7506/g.21355 Transcript_7506/m.21355 type:complete len:179 (+) Transcript_7506:89-625(+)|eukprot:CAMPEP_0119118176 /NCGR_PEP_ID=MMETSP1310-20130426/92_1 /TAXON_ID=464262 /ORGANISM="Genus nov. species nov., Strain RCC2339" /LENGTH=178 /DNA_ID=CAMNT_0007107515 /DNA_START=40 /DNA_END=576 /DNA_ORIENTATION=+